jgi:hypothetical protein
VTVVEKLTQKPAALDKSAPKPAANETIEEANRTTKVPTEIGDTSGTPVQKQSGAAEDTTSVSSVSRAPMISLKKESELLRDPQSAKDIVQVTIFMTLFCIGLGANFHP